MAVYRLPARDGGRKSVVPEPIDYRLPISVVHIRGSVTTTTSSLDPDSEHVERKAKIDVDVVADPGTAYRLIPPAGTGWSDRDLDLGLTSDGRLSSAGGEYTDRSGERLKAVVSLGATAAGGLAALGASPLVAGIAALGAATIGTVALRNPIEELDLIDGSSTVTETGQLAPPVLSPEDFGIRAEYESEHPADHLLLYQYRLALLRLTAEHAQTAAQLGLTATTRSVLLKNLGHALKHTRAEATIVEARYDAWLRSKETSHVEVIDRRLTATDVPDAKTFRRLIRHGYGADRPAWWRSATALRTMVTIDYLDDVPTTTTAPGPSSAGPGAIVYRTPRPAQLTTWKIVDSSTTASKLDVELVRRDRALITVPGTERTVTVVAEHKSGKVKLGIDPSGALTSVSISAKSSAAGRAETLSGLTSAAEQAVASGKNIGGTFDTKQLELDRLERELKLAETKAKLKGPADPDPTLAALQQRLAIARLEAELATADYVTANPSQATILITQST